MLKFIEHIQCAQYKRSKHSMFINTFNIYNNPEIDTLTVPILQMMKKGMQSLAISQGHTTDKQWSRGSNLVCLISELMLSLKKWNGVVGILKDHAGAVCQRDWRRGEGREGEFKRW